MWFLNFSKFVIIIKFFVYLRLKKETMKRKYYYREEVMEQVVNK